MANIRVSKMGKYNLINVDELSAFTMSVDSPTSERANILHNYNLACDTPEGLERFEKNLQLKVCPGLTNYELNIIRKEGFYQFCLPITFNRQTEIQLIKLSDNEKMAYIDAEKYNFFGVQGKVKVLDENNTFGDFKAQGILLIPIESDENSFIEEFIVDVIYDKYYTNISSKFDNFVFTSNIRDKYLFYAVCCVMNF